MRLNIPQHLAARESEIQSLLVKAINKTGDKLFSEHKWIREYQEGVIQYVEYVIEQVATGLALKLNVNPSRLKKSVKIPIYTLTKAAAGEDLDGMDLMYKSLFSKLKEKFTITKNFFKKFGFNNGKPLEPVNIKGKVIYNPETGRPLTKEEWKNITDGITDFLGDKIGDMEEEMIVRAGLFGKLMQAMEEDGIRVSDQKDMNWNDIEKMHGQIPDNIEEAVKRFNLSDPEVASLEYAKVHAGEHLSIEDGSLKNKIVSMVRNQITGGLEEGLSPSELVSRLYWIDPSDVLGARFSEDTVDAINRDWRRIALTELSYATNNGYLTANKAAAEKGEELYFVFVGGIIATSSKKCIATLGQIVKLVDKPRTSERIKDKYTNIAIWTGKNNIGRSQNAWWIAVPMHPNCIHYWERIYPEIEEWDSDIEKIIYKEAA